MTDLASKPLEKVIEYLLDATIRQLDYIIFCNSHVKELKRLVEILEINKKLVKSKVDLAKNNAREITPAVEHWLKKVEEKIKDSEEFHCHKALSFKTGCSSGALPFLWYRRKLGRRAKKMLAPEIKDLNLECASTVLPNIYCPPEAPSYAESNPSDGGYLEFKSRKDIIDKIMGHLKDTRVRMVGLYGPSGMGKTSLVNQIGKLANDSRLFEKVVTATVKKDPDHQKIQQDIADNLGLTFENEGENGRATRLRKRLKQENTLVILDDLWDVLDLNKIGIPFYDDDVSSNVAVKDRNEGGETDIGGKKVKNEDSSATTKGCKILVTSRYGDVLCNKMNVKENLAFRVPELYVDEAFTLFKKEVGMSNENSKFKPETLMKYCAGLPMAVIIVGRSLKNKRESEWEGELERLKGQESNEVHKYMENHVKLGYDNLESEELRSIFLVCAQISHQSLVTDLVKYCYGLGILKDVQTLRDARESISESIQKLKVSGLMLDSNSNDHFNMHDIVQDAAISIACKNQNVFILRNKTLNEWPDEEELEKCRVISIYKSHIVDELPEVVNCPHLRFFHIDNDDPTLKIPDRFFERMEKLRVLVLSGLHLGCLPSSIKNLSKLRMLCLEKCTLGDLSILTDLKKLRILSLSGSRIEVWPTDLEGLCKLQLLDISDCSMKRFTRPFSLSSFTSLEELHIRSSLTKMEVEGEVNHNQNSVLSELKHLHHLNTIDVCIPNVEFLPTDLFFHELNDYKIVIGDFETLSIGDFKMPHKYEDSRSLALQLEPGMDDIHSLKGIKLLFKGVENLLLGDLHGVQNAFYELNLDGFPNLKHLSIVNNKDIEYIVNSMELSLPHDAFSNLEFLSLFNLMKIKEICCSPIEDSSSFSRLRTVKVKMCPQLKSIFLFYIVKFLTSLETIDVSECDSLQAVVGEEEGGSNNKVKLQKLCSLTLQEIPSFVSFYKTNGREIVPAEDEESATTSLSLFNEKVEIPNLEMLELFSIKIHKIWSSGPSSSWFQNLIKLTLKDCCNLTYLCSLSVACNLNKLKSISISDCPLMERLFITEGNKNEYSEVPIFPKLEKIQLSDMEILKDIWPYEGEVSVDSFPSLISVDIQYCSKLEVIFPNHTKCWYLHLKSLVVYQCELVEFIFEIRGSPKQNDTKSARLEFIYLINLSHLKQVWSVDPKGVLNFINLQSIWIYDCKRMSNVLPSSVAKDLGKLESFWIQSCGNLEKIIACDGGSETSSEVFKFPEVLSMCFSELPSIQCFYKGRYIVECPKLKQLRMKECPNLEIFKIGSAKEEGRALFSIETVMSKLEHLEIDSKGEKWLISNRSKYRINSLKHLHLYKWQSHDETTLYCFLHTIPNLQILYLGYCHGIREFVPSGNTAPKPRLGSVLLLKEFTLSSSYMEDIGFERDPALQRSLHRLVLQDCSKLTRLAHSSVSFTHLTYLQVSYCGDLKTLMTCSTAKSLLQLTTIKVAYCHKLNEIVSNDEGNDDKEIKIVFAKLITIEFEGLSNLASFCSNENCEFSMPLLEKVILKGCPKMKTFAKLITTPRLRSVLVSERDEEKGYWKGDLNRTLQMLFADMVHYLGLITTPKLPRVLVSERDAHEEKGYSEGNLNSTLQMLFGDKVDLLELFNQPELKQVWCDQTLEQVNLFQNVKSLVVKRCGYLVHVIPSHLLHCFKNLENLEVSDCDGVQVIFNMEGNSNKMTKAIAISRLKKLSLENLPNLEHVWNTYPKGVIHFQALQDLRVDRCDTLEYVLPSSMAKDLAMLSKLSIKNCEKVVKIFAEDKIITELEDTAITIVLDSLGSLYLMGVPMLKYFYPGQHKLQFPKLTTLNIEACKWMILNCQEAETFVDQEIIVPLEQVNWLFHSLETLSFDMRGAMLTWELKSRKLEFGKSQERVEEVLFEEKPKAGYVEFLSHLKGLSLHSLYTLKSIGFENSWIHLILDNIQTLEVKWCDDIKNLVASKVSFSSVTKLDIRGCDGLLYLFTSSTAESLSQLKEMKISECKSMREIISKEDDESNESNESIIFEQLQVLHLADLPMLRWFYSGKRTLYFPSLQQLSMFSKLWRMTTFCPHIHINLDSVKLRSGFWYNPYAVEWKENVDDTIRKMNDKKIGLRESQYYQEMWRGSLPIPEACFSNLESLVVHQCDFLSEVIPANLLPFLNNLQHLEVQKCRFVKTIFDVKCLTKDKIIKLPIEFSLKKLVLENLPNLDTIWNEDPDGILHFQLLQQVSVDTCKSLTSLFPESVAKDLNKLENLELKHCESMVEIIPFPGIQATPQETTRDSIMFPCLTSLTLLDLPSFNCFYCSFHYVRLKTLNGHDDPPIENQVCFKEVTPKLVNLSLSEKEAKMIGHEQCEESHFYNLNVSNMQSFNVKIVSDELPYAFLQKASCIKSLEVSNSSIKEIFCYERPNLDCVQFLSHLKELKLTSLSKLTSIGFEHSWIRESSILNLTHLTISKCDSMIYLFTSATAKSLIQLKQMTISDCKSMQWIVSNEGEAIHGDQIVFKQLQELQFECLKSLRRFCNGGFTLSFPSLEKLEVFECDRMETFCESTINTNKLSEVFFIEYGVGTPLEDDLNSTIHNAYKTEVANFLREVKELKLSEHPRIHGIWNCPFRVPSFCFIRLKILIVEKCEFTSVVIPSHILGLLCQLEELVVRQCDSVKAIFEVTPEAKDTQTTSLRSSLKKLTIEELPNLEHVWDSDPTQHISFFQSFQQVYVHGCNNLESLFPESVVENLIKLEKLEVINCDKLVEIVAKDEAAVEGTPKEFALQSMTSIKLWNLPELKCFYPASHKLECPKLEEVHLFHCVKLKTFECESQRSHPSQSDENQVIFFSKKVFPCLKFVALCKEIMMMLHGQFDLNDLSKLEAFQLQCFHDDSDTFPYELLQQLHTIEKLLVSCSSFKEIFCTERPTMDSVKEIVIPHLKCLQLSTLSQLNSIGLEHAWMQHFSENLEKLQIDECHCLTSIVPSKVSFSSLIELNISKCNGLVNLFTPSTSRTLHQLNNMSIQNCESLEEIVSEEEVEELSKFDEEEIMFKKLKTLSLRSLPNLGRFYNGNMSLKFPSLVQLLLIDCNKMKSFCGGTVSVNRWMEVQFRDEDTQVSYYKREKHAFLVEDLNLAVQNIFDKFY